jgi:ketosteroid isomerase-like protein
MSQANVEIVKRMTDAFNLRDVDAFAELAASDFEWFPAMDRLVEGGTYRGRGGIEAYFEAVSGTWEEFRLLPDEFRDLGDRVLWLGRVEGRGRSSGVRVDTPLGTVVEFRDGKVLRLRGFLDHGEALRAAEPSE